MIDRIEGIIVQQIIRMHELLFKVTDNLTEEQMAWFPSQTAPCIGWHLWHISRWADT